MVNLFYIVLEEETDKMFFEELFEKVLYNKYDQVLYFKYAKKKKEKTIKYIEAIKELNADFIIIGDMNDADNIKNAIDKVLVKIGCDVNTKNIIIAIKEIESWYMAGISNGLIDEYNIECDLSNTEIYYKEDILAIKPTKLTKFYFFINILNKFDIKIARKRNSSFNYLCDHIQKYM